MPIMLQTKQGRVTGIWGSALIRGEDGQWRPLKIGEMVMQGDELLTSQDGLVRLNPDAIATASTELEYDAPGAGGGGSALGEGLRVDRISESVTPAGMNLEPVSLAAPTFDRFIAAVAPPSIVIEDLNGVDAGEGTIQEAAPPISGTITITAPGGIAQVIVAGKAFDSAQLADLQANPVTIPTDKGNLVLTGFNETTGVLTYSYSAPALDNPKGVIDSIPVVVIDATERGVSDTLDITITDTGPVAVNDVNGVKEDTVLSATGNVLGNDTPGADATTIASIVGSTPGALGTSTEGTYGSLVLQPDGSYVYTLNNSLPAVQALNDGQSLDDVFTYTLTDQDGSTSTATLTVKIDGVTDGVPIIFIPDLNGVQAGENTVVEAGPAAVGTIEISAPAGFLIVSIGGVNFTPADLAALKTTPVSIPTTEGTLVLTDYSGDGKAGVIAYSYSAPDKQSPVDVLDAIPVVLVDNTESAIRDSLDIVILDTGPLAMADVNLVKEDTLLTASGNVITNDQLAADPAAVGAVNGSAANVSAPVTGTYGILVLNPNGTYAYTLNNADPAVQTLLEGQKVTDTFTYTLTDHDGSSSQTTLTITVEGTTDGGPKVIIPDVNGDEVTVTEAGPAVAGTIELNAPDGFDNVVIHGQSFTLAQLAALNTTPVSITTPEGTLVLNGYTPNATDASVGGTVKYDYSAPDKNSPAPVLDSVSVTLTDKAATSATDTLDARILDTVPKANPDTNSVKEDTTLTATGNVVTNDTLGADPATVTAISGTAAGTVGGNTAGTYGTLVLGANGTYAYTLNNADPAVQTLLEGQKVTDTFTYTLTDHDGSSSQTTLTITVEGTTDGGPKVIIPDVNGDEVTVTEAGPAVAGTIELNAPDGFDNVVIHGQSFTLAQLAALNTTPVSITTPEGTLVLNGYTPNATDASVGGTVKYDYSAPDKNSPAPVLDSVSVTLTDKAATSATDTLDARILDTVPKANPDTNSVKEDTTLTATGNVVTNDTLGADPATVTAISGTAAGTVGGNTAGTYGTLVLGANGTYAYTLNNADPAVQTLLEGQKVTDTFTYTLTDHDGSSSQTTLTITVEGTTDGGPKVIIPDVNGDEVTVTEAGPAVAGTIELNAPDGFDNVVIHGQSFTLAQLAALNTTPVSITTPEGTLVLNGYTPNATDASVGGTVKYDYSAPDKNSPAPVLDSVSVTLTDKAATSATDTLDARILDTVPKANPDTNSVKEDTTLTATGNVVTNDTLGADPATVTAISGTAAGTVGGNTAGTYGTLVLGANGTYAYTLNNADPAVQTLLEGQKVTDTFTYTLTDHDGSSSQTTLTITVEGTTDGGPKVIIPDVNGDEVTVTEAGPAVAGTIELNAPDGFDNVVIHGQSFTLAQLAALNTTPVSITTPEGTLVLNGYTPNATDASVGGTVKYDYSAPDKNSPAPVLDSVSVTLTDKAATSATDTLDARILDTVPKANPDTNSVKEDTTLTATGNVVTNDTLGADPATVTAISGTAAGTVGGNTAGTYGTLVLGANGTYAYTLNNADPAVQTLLEGQKVTDTFTYTLTDHDGSSSQTTLTITVEGTTDGGPKVIIPDVNGDEVTVTEAGPAVAGTIELNAPDGFDNVVIHGQSFTLAQLAALNTTPVSITTPEGTLVLNGYTPNATDASVGGTVKYDYSAPDKNSPAPVLDSVSVTLTDKAATSATDTLDARILDTVPKANPDTNSVKEDTTLTATGNVVTNDTLGADPATVTAISGTAAGTVGGNTAGTYGTLVLGANGTYAYTLNNADPAVQTLLEGQKVTDTFTYTLTDHDGSSSQTTLTITVEGTTDGGPKVIIPDVNGDEVTVTEAGPAVAGTIELNAPDGFDNVVIHGQSFTLAQLAALNTTPVSITTPEGTLVLNGYTPNATDASVGGTVKYDYSAPDKNSPAPVLDSVSVTLTDKAATSATDTLDARILDTVPKANPDTNSVKEDTTLTATGNVVTNDTLGADPATVTAISGTAAGTVGGNTAGTYGTLVLGANGTYAYTLNNADPAVNALNDGQKLTDTFTYTLTDHDGSSSSTTLAITINGTNDAPVVVNGSATVSEEGLAGGIPDALGTPNDTTDATVVTGKMVANDPDSTIAGWTLTAPTTALMSNGVAVTWTGSGTQSLTAKAGALDIATLTIDNAGNYTFTLKGPVDHSVTDAEDVMALNFGATASDGALTGTGVLTINVEDDSPRAAAPVDYTTRLIDSNLLFVLDVSGSMNLPSGIGAQTRLQSAVESIRTLIDKYDDLGEVRVRVVTFSTNAEAQGTSWGTPAQAQVLLNAILAKGPGGGTNYDEALADAISAFNSPGKLPVGQAVSYFLSDGEPTFGSGDINTLVPTGTSPGTPPVNGTGYDSTGADTGIQANEEATWTNFLAGNSIRSFALGMGGDAKAGPLNPIAYNGSTNTNTDSVVVTDFKQLDAVLEGTIPDVIQANLFTAGGASVGADGLFVKSLTIDGTTYTYTPGPAAGPGTVTVAGGADKGSFNAATQTLTVTTAVGGKFVVDLDDGGYTYVRPATLAKTTAEKMNYVLSDHDGDTTASYVGVTVKVNEAPQVTDQAAAVSEEGLPGGIPDNVGAPSDTTNTATVTGKMVAVDPDGKPITGWTLEAPTEALSSHGVNVTWTGGGTPTLKGMAGAKEVATISINNAGEYTFTLKAPIDHPTANAEDVLPLNFRAKATDGSTSGFGTLTINVEDDSPGAASAISASTGLLDSNLLIVLDTSGSMALGSGIAGQTRLQSAVQSVKTLLDKYDDLGDVAVRLVTFSTNAEAKGSNWTTVAQAKVLLDAVLKAGPGGGTNYDEALGDAITGYASSSKLGNAQNVSYFLSDGEPTFGSGTTSQLTAAGMSPGTPTPNGTGYDQSGADTGIQSDEEAIWVKFLQDNTMQGYALGMGNDVSVKGLNPVAYDGRASENRNGIVVSAFSQLDAVLEGTVQPPVNGNLFNSLGAAGAGGDGGLYVRSLTIDGKTYVYTHGATDGAKGSVTGGGSFDAVTQTLTVMTAIGGKFVVDLDNGAYRYERPATLGASTSEKMAFTLSDFDGDTTSSILTVDVSKATVHQGTGGDDTLTGGNGVNILIGGDGNDHLIGGKAADELYGGNGSDLLEGGDGDDKLYGGAGNDMLIGGNGNDVLYGGAGNDTLTGGSDSDVFAWRLYDAGTPGVGKAIDTITDFDVKPVNANGDVLDLRDLLIGEVKGAGGGAGNLHNYLDFDTESQPGSTVIHVSTTGKFTSGNYSAAAEDQQIVLSNVDLRADMGLAANSTDNQIIQELYARGKLVTD